MNWSIEKGSLSTEYAVKSDSIRHPAIQSTLYTPMDGETPQLCLDEASRSLLSDEMQTRLGLVPTEARFHKKKEDAYLLSSKLRFIPLGIPRIFGYHKKDKQVVPLVRGMKLREQGVVSITRIPFCILDSNGILTNDDGEFQIFTLKLNSKKTSLVFGDRDDPSFSSLRSLNESLQKHYKAPGSTLVHLVSVALGVVPRVETSVANGDESQGIRFIFNGGAKPLTTEQQEKIFCLVQTEEVINMLKDPFRILTRSIPLPEEPYPIDSPYPEEF